MKLEVVEVYDAMPPPINFLGRVRSVFLCRDLNRVQLCRRRNNAVHTQFGCGGPQ